ncbi:MAG TPA: acyltransferase family protein, partial [Dongiaceae bacterium]
SNWLDSVTSSGFQPTMLGWLRNAFWVVFFIDGHTSYNALLWTMKFEWYGSLLVFLIARLLPGRLWRLSVALLLLAVLGQVPGYAVLHLFMAGMILHDATVMMRAWQGDRPPSSSLVGDVAGIFLVGLGFYLPRLIMMMIDAQGTSLMALLWLRQALPSWQGDRWMLAAIPVVVGVLLSPKLRYFLSNSLGRFLGKISFPLYLFHLPVILSLGSWLLLSLLSRTNLIPAALVAFAVTASVALLIAWIMTILVEAPTLRLAGRFGALIDRAWAWICPWYRVLPIKGAA